MAGVRVRVLAAESAGLSSLQILRHLPGLPTLRRPRLHLRMRDLTAARVAPTPPGRQGEPDRPANHPSREDHVMDDVIRTAEQIVVIEAARAYLAETEGQVVDTADNNQLVSHLMAAEVLLMKIARAFTQPATA